MRRGIRFDHVSFAYPGTSRVVLDDVSVTLPAGAVTVMDRLCPRCDAVAVRDEPGKNPDLEQVLARVPTETRLTFADGAPKIERSRVGDATHLVVTHEPWCEAGPAKLEQVAGGGWN